jgi:Zn-dependent metalloprotease
MPETHICTILPPHILDKLAQNGSKADRQRALQNLQAAAEFRGERRIIGRMPALLGLAPGTKRRTIYDAGSRSELPGTFVRGEGQAADADLAAVEAYDSSGDTYDFYNSVFGRNSIDGKGMRLDSTVHFGVKYDNAMWNGQQMVYGDGDGVRFNRFTIALDVIGHELTHGVTQATAALQYHDQPGALNEHFSDVFGVLVKQWKLNHSVAAADWLIGAGLFTKNVKGVAVRSMKAPGTAYDDPVLGKDPQPADLKHYVEGTFDNGGVHINSGIPNRAFYLAATAIGGFAWKDAGAIWYRTLTQKVRPAFTFVECAEATIQAAQELFGAAAKQVTAVQNAWAEVGVIKAVTPKPKPKPRAVPHAIR